MHFGDEGETRPAVTHLRSVRTVTLIEAVVCEGEGTHEDPVRFVTYYLTLDGEPVAASDVHGISKPAGIGAVRESAP